MNIIIYLVAISIWSIVTSANPIESNEILIYSIPINVSQKCIEAKEKPAMVKCSNSSYINRDQMLASLKALQTQCVIDDEIIKDRKAMIYCCSLNDYKNCVSQFCKV